MFAEKVKLSHLKISWFIFIFVYLDHPIANIFINRLI